MLSRNPEELVSWGHEPTRQVAEAAAGKELQDLSAGAIQGGQVANHNQAVAHLIACKAVGR